MPVAHHDGRAGALGFEDVGQQLRLVPAVPALGRAVEEGQQPDLSEDEIGIFAPRVGAEIDFIAEPPEFPEALFHPRIGARQTGDRLPDRLDDVEIEFLVCLHRAVG